MSKTDRIKEEWGLKVVLGILAATALSLIAWLAQNFSSASRIQVLIGRAAVVSVMGAVARVNRMAYALIKQLNIVMEWAPIVALLVFLAGLGLVVPEATVHHNKG